MTKESCQRRPSMHVSYLVPDLPFDSEDDFKKGFFGSLDELSEAGFEFVQSASSQSATQIIKRFSDDPETTHISVVEDHVPHLRYLELASEHDDALQTVRAVLRRHLPIVDHDEIVSRTRTEGPASPLVF